jgi:hypothetical protein
VPHPAPRKLTATSALMSLYGSLPGYAPCTEKERNITRKAYVRVGGSDVLGNDIDEIIRVIICAQVDRVRAQTWLRLRFHLASLVRKAQMVESACVTCPLLLVLLILILL